MAYEDIIYEKKDGIAKITMNRPKVLNAFRPTTIFEMVDAFEDAGKDRTIGVVVLTGAGDKSFCSGGDSGDRKSSGGAYGEAPTKKLHELIRNVPQPVIAAVNGYAVGHGNIFVSLCDLAIASETAKFAQLGPKVGSAPMGMSAELLARNIGDKKAKEMWFLCHMYTAQEALEMGLINKVVPPDKLYEEVDIWCKELLAKSPTALRRLKMGFTIVTDQILSWDRLNKELMSDYWKSDEGQEGFRAYLEKRAPDYNKFRK